MIKYLFSKNKPYDQAKAITYGELCINGENLDYEYINRELGGYRYDFADFRKKKKHEKIPVEIFIRKKDNVCVGWEYNTPHRETEADLYERLDDLINEFSDKKEKLKLIKEKFPGSEVRVCVVLENHQWARPGICLEHRHIEFLHDIGAEFETDCYQL